MARNALPRVSSNFPLHESRKSLRSRQIWLRNLIPLAPESRPANVTQNTLYRQNCQEWQDSVTPVTFLNVKTAACIQGWRRRMALKKCLRSRMLEPTLGSECCRKSGDIRSTRRLSHRVRIGRMQVHATGDHQIVSVAKHAQFAAISQANFADVLEGKLLP